MSHSRAALGAILLLAVGGAAAAAPPIPVSPGAADRFAGVGTPCPTFSWSAVDGASGYELVVYRTPAAAAAAAGPDSGAEPLLRHRIPGRALSWTPAAEGCLELSGSYAWAVRATGAGDGEWSESRLFRIDVAAALGDLGPEARRAIRRELRRQDPDRERRRSRRGARVASAAAASARSPEVAAAPVGDELVDAGGGRHVGRDPEPRGVFSDDVELWLEETGSGAGDKVQLVFATPEFDGSPSDAWAIIVDAFDGGVEDGKMFFSTPSFFDALQLFTDGSAIVGEQRELKLRRLTSPPIACTSFLQEGLFYWDSTISALCVCDGSIWKPVDDDETGSCV